MAEKVKKEPNHVPYMVMAIIGIVISVATAPIFLIFGNQGGDSAKIGVGFAALFFLIAQPLVGVGVTKWIINAVQEKKLKNGNGSTSEETQKGVEKADTFDKK